jgi:hypothetical protein
MQNSREALEQAIIGKAVDLLSDLGGLASFLRRLQLGVRLGGPSLPLDVGYAESIPASIRNAVILRDRPPQVRGPGSGDTLLPRWPKEARSWWAENTSR